MNLVSTLPLLSSHVLLSFASFLSLHSATSILSLSSHLVTLSPHALQLASACAICFPLVAISQPLHLSESYLDVLRCLVGGMAHTKR